MSRDSKLFADTWEIRLGECTFPYHFDHACAARIAAALGRYDTDRFVVVTDDTVLGLHGHAFVSALSATPGTLTFSQVDRLI